MIEFVIHFDGVNKYLNGVFKQKQGGGTFCSSNLAGKQIFLAGNPSSFVWSVNQATLAEHRFCLLVERFIGSID